MRERAYQIWLADGRPEGCDEEHWRLALAEIEAEDRTASGDQRPELPNPFIAD